MAEEPGETSEKRVNESLVCDVCGRFGAVEFGDRRLCPDCYGSYGSCCPEFGREEEDCSHKGDKDVPPAEGSRA